MRNFSIELPRYRLNINLKFIKRRKPLISEPLLPSRKELSKYRSGNLLIRFFRYIFEHKNVKKFLGTNIALAIIASNVVGTKAISNVQAASDPMVSANVIELKTESGIQMPVKGSVLTQGFTIFHPAVDLAVPYGTSIYPIKSGVVENIQHGNTGYGNAVIVNHGNEITSLYAHMSKVEVTVGQQVDLTTEIGKVGLTGHTTGPHVHVEIRDNGVPINPLTVLPR